MSIRLINPGTAGTPGLLGLPGQDGLGLSDPSVTTDTPPVDEFNMVAPPLTDNTFNIDPALLQAPDSAIKGIAPPLAGILPFHSIETLTADFFQNVSDHLLAAGGSVLAFGGLVYAALKLIESQIPSLKGVDLPPSGPTGPGSPKSKAARGGHLYNNLPGLTDSDRALLQKLYPKGIDKVDLYQGQIGDCYIVSVLHAFRQLPLAPYFIARMIKEVPGGWEVSFPSGRRQIFVSYDDVAGKVERAFDKRKQKMVTGYFLSGTLGDRIFERALARAVRVDRGGSAGETIAVSIGGFAEEVYEKFLRGMVTVSIFGNYRQNLRKHSQVSQASYYGGGYTLQDIERAMVDYERNPSQTIFWVATPPHTSGQEVHFYVDPGKKFVGQHAYVVSAVDSAGRLVTIVNPHDTSKENVITYEQFFDYFSRIEIATFKKESLKQYVGDDTYSSLTKREGISGKLVPHVDYHYSINKGDQLTLKLGNDYQIKFYKDEQGVYSLNGLVKKYVMPGESIVLGRLANPSLPGSVSREHLKLTVNQSGIVTLEDLGSANETTVEWEKAKIGLGLIELGVKVRDGYASLLEKLDYQLRIGEFKVNTDAGERVQRKLQPEYKKELSDIVDQIYRRRQKDLIDEMEAMLKMTTHSDLIQKEDYVPRKPLKQGLITLGVKVREGTATSLEELMYRLEAADTLYRSGKGLKLKDQPELLEQIKVLELKIVKSGTRAEINEAEDLIRQYGLQPNY